MKLTFNAPATLLLAVISLVFLIFSPVLSGLATVPVLGIFIHAGWQHYFSNIMFLLLLGPIVEEKYGSIITGVMILLTGFFTYLLNALIFPGTLIVGASGIVFMFIMLASITNVRGNQIPITLILVALMYLGQEFINSLKPDNISQFGHIAGGICGTILGFTFNRIKL